MVHTIKVYFIVDKHQEAYFMKKFGKHISKINKVEEVKRKGVRFSVNGYYRNGMIFMCLNIIEVFGRGDITEEDSVEIKNIINEITSQITGSIIPVEITLTRIDYRVDVIVADPIERALLLSCFSRGLKEYKRKIKNIAYIERGSLYYGNKGAHILLYDKEKERMSKGRKVETWDKDVLRLEFALKNRHLNYRKSAQGMAKEIANYFNLYEFYKYMGICVPHYILIYDFCTVKKTKEIIWGSKIRRGYNVKLEGLVVNAARYGLDYAKEMYKTQETYKKHIDMLTEMGLNVITLPARDSNGRDYLVNPFRTFFIEAQKNSKTNS